MSSDLPKLFLARHGDTAWTDSHQHTGRTDLPLNARGEEHAPQLGERLRGFSFVRVFTSPLQRASKTCELAGFGAVAEVDPDLIEWDYGRFEGKLTERHPEGVARLGALPRRLPRRRISRRRGRREPTASSPGCTDSEGNVLAFSSGHIIRMIAARWNGLPPVAGRVFFCRPASVGVLGFEHDSRDEPIIRLWNYVSEPRE